MNLSRLTSCILAVCAVIIVAAFLFLRTDDSSIQRLSELEREVASLRQELQNNVRGAAFIATSAQQSAPEKSPASSAHIDTSGLDQQIADLSTTVARLEQTALDLDRRTARPLELAHFESEVQRQVQLYQADAAEVQRIADQFNVRLDERAFTDYGYESPLNKHPDFIELRVRMLQRRRILDAAEKKYVTELFERTSSP